MRTQEKRPDESGRRVAVFQEGEFRRAGGSRSEVKASAVWLSRWRENTRLRVVFERDDQLMKLTADALFGRSVSEVANGRFETPDGPRNGHKWMLQHVGASCDFKLAEPCMSKTRCHLFNGASHVGAISYIFASDAYCRVWIQ
jgi:hypothetical protein